MPVMVTGAAMTSSQLEPAIRETPLEGSVVLRVSEVKQTYFGGKMSLRWWYRQVELGRLPHVRAGGSILVRKTDVEAFVAAAYQAESVTPVDPPDTHEAYPQDKPRSSRVQGGLRFFGR